MKHTFTFKHTKKLLPLLALLLLVVTACNKKNDVNLSGTAYIEFTNASQTDSPVDFYVSSAKKNTLPVPYGQSTDYFSVSTGTTLPASIKVNTTGVTLASLNLTPLPNAYYSIFYFGGITVAYIDDLSIAAGKSRIRFINLNKGLTGSLDFGVKGAPTPLVTGLGAAFDSAYYSVTPGSTFSVYAAGTTSSILDIPTTTEAGHVYTIYLSGATTADLQANILLQK